MLALTEVDAQIRQAKDAPIGEVPAFRKILRVTRLPLPLRRLMWLVGLNFGRQRANWFGSFGVTSVAAYGAGELHALSPGPFILSYGVVAPDQTIDVVIRWDHRITDAALIAKALTRLEQVLNSEIAAELRGQRQQPSPSRSGRSRPEGAQNPSFRGDAKHRTRNLEIPGSSLPRRPGMTVPRPRNAALPIDIPADSP